MCSITGYMMIVLGVFQIAGITFLGTLVGGNVGTGALLVLAGIAYTWIARRSCAGGACRIPKQQSPSPRD